MNAKREVAAKAAAIEIQHHQGMLAATTSQFAMLACAFKAKEMGHHLSPDNSTADLTESDVQNLLEIESDLDMCAYSFAATYTLVHSHFEQALIEIAKLLCEHCSSDMKNCVGKRLFALHEIEITPLHELRRIALTKWLHDFDHFPLRKKCETLLAIFKRHVSVQMPATFHIDEIEVADKFRQQVIHNPKSVMFNMRDAREKTRVHHDCLSNALRVICDIFQKYLAVSCC